MNFNEGRKILTFGCPSDNSDINDSLTECDSDNSSISDSFVFELFCSEKMSAGSYNCKQHNQTAIKPVKPNIVTTILNSCT